jgi:hypothetical protein
MKNLVFMLWNILWPLSITLGNYIDFKMGTSINEIGKANKKIAPLVLFIWILIAFLLYEK